MLVLARKLNEGVIISKDGKDVVSITVVRIGRNNIRLGIEAPSSLKILRRELVDKESNICVQNKAYKSGNSTRRSRQ